jgi:hypothetical protein
VPTPAPHSGTGLANDLESDFSRYWNSDAMRTLSLVSDSELQDAEGIHTVDPNDSHAAGHQLWGHRSEESQAQTSNDRTVVEIALPSDNHVALLALIERVERVKGRLPPEVEVLRRNLSS